MGEKRTVASYSGRGRKEDNPSQVLHVATRVCRLKQWGEDRNNADGKKKKEPASRVKKTKGKKDMGRSAAL